MSVHVSSAVWRLDLSSSAKIVLLFMADKCDDDGRNAFPAVATIARRCGFSPRQVQRILGELRAAGLLVTDAEATPRFPAIYRVNVGAGVELDEPARGDNMSPLKRAPARQHVALGVTPATPQGRHPRRPRGDTHVTRPIHQPPDQPSSDTPAAAGAPAFLSALHADVFGVQPTAAAIAALGGFDEADLRYAYDEARTHQARSWRYVEAAAARRAAQAKPTKRDASYYTAGKYGSLVAAREKVRA